jgi:hypothetical protein
MHFNARLALHWHEDFVFHSPIQFGRRWSHIALAQHNTSTTTTSIYERSKTDQQRLLERVEAIKPGALHQRQDQQHLLWTPDLPSYPLSIFES